MADITKAEDIRASGTGNHPGPRVRSVSDIAADSTSDAGRGGDDAENDITGRRPEKIRRVDGAGRSIAASSSSSDRRYDRESNDGGGGDKSAEPELSDDDHFSRCDGFSADDDDDDDGIASPRDEARELNEENLLRLRRGDPRDDVASLVARRASSSASGEEAGRCVGESARLKKLAIEGEFMNWKGGDDSRTAGWLSEFAAGLARNRSIHRLSLNECHLDVVPSAVATLSPFFERNANLHSLEIVSCNLGNDLARVLASALSRRRDKSSLRRINLDANLIGDESGRELVDALRGYDRLSELSLGDNEIGGRSCAALQDLLSGPNAGLEALNVENNFVDDGGVASLATALANDDASSLRELSLSFNCNITDAGWRILFSSCLRNPRSALETLDVSSTNILDEGAVALGRSLSDNKTLKTLNLYDVSSHGMPLITGAGWRGFFACLRNRESALEQIDLRYSSIDGGGLSALSGVLADNSSVRVLDLSHNARVAAAEWRSFFACLDDPDVAIEELYLCGNDIADAEAACLARSLTNNGALKTVDLGAGSSVSGLGLATFSRLLCDKSSIDGIVASNHALQYLGDLSVPADVDALLQLNEFCSKKDVAREKIIKYYFQNGETHVEELLKVELKVVPHAISWVCRDGAGNSLLYELSRKLPSLFLSMNRAKASGANGKQPPNNYLTNMQ